MLSTTGITTLALASLTLSAAVFGQGSPYSPTVFPAGSGIVSHSTTLLSTWPNALAGWSTYSSGGPSTAISRSTNGGTLWSAATTLAGAKDPIFLRIGSNVALFYIDSSNSTLRTHASTDEGATWIPSLSTAGSQVSDTGITVAAYRAIAVDSRYCVAYRTGGGAIMYDEFELASSTPSWGVDTSLAVNSTFDFELAASSTSTGQGRIGMSYRLAVSPQGAYFRSKTLAAGATWSPGSTITANTPCSAHSLVALTSGSTVSFASVYAFTSSSASTYRFAIESSGTWPDTSISSSIRVEGDLDALFDATNNQVHAFFCESPAVGPRRIKHTSLSPTGTLITAQLISDIADTLTADASPRGVLSDGYLCCAWLGTLAGNSATSLDPIFNFAIDTSGVYTWRNSSLAISTTGFSSGGTNSLPSISVGKGCMIACVQKGSTGQTEIQPLTTYTIEFPSSGFLDDPVAYSNELPLLNTNISFRMHIAPCAGTPGTSTFSIMSIGAVAPTGSCQLYANGGSSLSFQAVLPGQEPSWVWSIPNNPAFNGLDIYFQGAVVSSSVCSTCQLSGTYLSSSHVMKAILSSF